MRKIFLTIGISLFMMMITYAPLASSFLRTQIVSAGTPAGEGEACNETTANTPCKVGLKCDYNATPFPKCVKNSAASSDACFYDQDCGQGFHCEKSGGASQGQCTQGGGFGSTCNAWYDCGSAAYYCSTETNPKMCLRIDKKPDPLAEANSIDQQDDDGIDQNDDDGIDQNDDDGINQTPPSGCDSTTQFCNPLLSKYDTLCKVLEGALNLITQIGAILAVILIIWTGFKFITAQGNEKKLTDAKRAFVTTIIGTAILLGASAIAQIVVKTVFSITNKDNPGICQI